MSSTRSTTVTQLPEQSLLDMALQQYGSVRGLMLLAEDNPGLVDFSRPYTAKGTPFVYRADVYTEPLANAAVVARYRTRGTQPAHGNPRPCGVGWMCVGVDMKVGVCDCTPCSNAPDPTAGGAFSDAFSDDFDNDPAP